MKLKILAFEAKSGWSVQLPTMLAVTGEGAEVWTTDVSFQSDGGAAHATRIESDSASVLLRRTNPTPPQGWAIVLPYIEQPEFLYLIFRAAPWKFIVLAQQCPTSPLQLHSFSGSWILHTLL